MQKNIKKLYQQVLLDHNKNPRNFKAIENATHVARGVNPLCGDEYVLYLSVDEGVVKDIGFKGQGCAISKSVSSMMTQAVLGKHIRDVSQLKDQFIHMLTEELSDDEANHLLGHLTIFKSVKDFPIRVKCATLIWRALEAAINQTSKDVSTE